MHLGHTTPSSGNNEYSPPPKFGNQLAREEILSAQDKILEFVEAGMNVTEMHNHLQRDGKKLGEEGKYLVSVGGHVEY